MQTETWKKYINLPKCKDLYQKIEREQIDHIRKDNL